MSIIRPVSVLAILATALLAPAQDPPENPGLLGKGVPLIDFDKDGKWDPQKLDAIKNRLKARFPDAPPTDVFLLAHGWNNSSDSARKKYDPMVTEMVLMADEHKLIPEGFRPAVVGLHWPSLAFEKTEDMINALVKDLNLPAQFGVKKLLKQKKLGRLAGELLRKIQTALEENVSNEPVRNFVSDLARALSAEKLADLEDKLGKQTDVETVADVIRVFTYWDMKERAGVVGKTGASKMLADLQKEYKDARFHLIGHSFGCKLWLSVLNSDPVRPVDTLILIQGAVSSQALAEKVTVKEEVMKGGYHDILARKRVRGPIIATHTDQDIAVGKTYPVGSLLAGQVAEIDGLKAREKFPEVYQGMGAHGITGAQRITPQMPGKPFGFKPGTLYNFDATGTKAITGHSEFCTPETAWMIWAAVLGK